MVDLPADAVPAAVEDHLRLARSLRPRHIDMIAIGGTIGAGIFVGSSVAIASAGPSIIISYLLAAIVLLLVMRMLGEMAIAYTGHFSGVTVFTEYARIGLGNWAGFVAGWLYWFFWLIVVPVEAIAAAGVLQPLFGMEQWQIGLILVVAMTATNLWSTRSYGEFEFWFASIKVAAIISFIVICAVYLFGMHPPAAGVFSNLSSDRGFAPFGVPAIFAGVTSVFFALVGCEVATVAAAESEEPAPVISRMAISLVLRVAFFYIGSIFLIVCILPWVSIVPGKSPFVAVLNEIGIPGASLAMNFIVLTAVLSALNSAIYVSSRTLFALSARGDAPQYLVALNKRRVPTRSILLGTVLGYLCVIAAIISPTVVFAFLVNGSGAVVLFVYLIVAIAHIKIRRRLEATEPERLKLKMWFFPWLSYFAIACILAVLVAMAFTPALVSQFYSSIACLAVAVVAFLARKRFGKKIP